MKTNQPASAARRQRSGAVRPGPALVPEKIVQYRRFNGERMVQMIVPFLPSSAARPTPARLRLPEPLGDRTLFDAGTIGLGGSGG